MILPCALEAFERKPNESRTERPANFLWCNEEGLATWRNTRWFSEEGPASWHPVGRSESSVRMNKSGPVPAGEE